ncbi:hypothetical protein GZL_08782 [Streptomyces sp. 769]|nr:hypothetical protein GZL_08782 [Streptomyces sp. 769]
MKGSLSIGFGVGFKLLGGALGILRRCPPAGEFAGQPPRAPG